MKKKFLAVLTVLLVILISVTIVACNDYTDPDDSKTDDDEITRTQVVTNGTFYKASSTATDAYVKETVTGWTATKGSLATNANGVTMGVIDLNDTTAYDLNKDRFAYDEGGVTFDNPGVDKMTPKDTDDEGKPIDKLQDTNALVLASKVNSGSVYYKNASSFTLEAGKYYVLQYSVASKLDFTDVAEADKSKKGAWVHVTGGVEYVDSCINTDGKWETRYLYIEANKTKSTSIDIRLWLGHGPEKISGNVNPYSTRGAVMFDNIIIKEVDSITDPAYNGGAAVVFDKDKSKATENHKNFELLQKNAITEEGANSYVSSYYLADLNLEQTTETTPTSTNAINYFYSFRPGVYTSTNVNNYTLVKGKDGVSSTDQPSVTNAYTGIVDLSKLYASDATAESKDTYSTLLPSSYSFTAPSYDDWKNKIMNGAGSNRGELLNGSETKALMIFHNDLSGAGFKNKNSIVIEKNKYYKISVWVYVWAPVKDGNIDFPTSNGPKKPTDYTEQEQAFVNIFNNVENNYDAFVGYFEALSAEEKAIAEGAEPSHETTKEDIEALVSTSDYLSKVGSAYGDVVGSFFVYKYMNDNFDGLVEDGTLKAADKDYVNYRYLNERAAFLKDTWPSVESKKEKWDNYDEELLEFMAKYTVWQEHNVQPKAKVKLTGAGDDIEETTATCNEKWEELTFYIQGNQLSNRNLTLEFWFGEGNSTEYENLMFGGALFDNISIDEVGKDSIPVDKDWTVLSPLTDAKELEFGGLIGEETVADHWENELAEGTAAGDASKVTMNVQRNEEIGTVTLGDEVINLNELVYSHNEGTASILKSKDEITIKPNTAYRLAMWVKTEGIAEGKGITVALMGGKDGEDKTSVSSVTTFNKEEWTEVVFYILGDVMETNKVSLQFTVGSGTRFSTDSYIEGKVYVAVVNCTEIKYSEYNASGKSGDEIKTYSFTNTGSASDSVTNGSFSSIDYGSTDNEEFGEGGELTGVAKPSSWSSSSVKNNTFNTVELAVNTVNADAKTYKLNWKPVVGVDKDGKDTLATAYEVYARFNEDGKSVERPVAIIQANTSDATVYEDGKYYYNIDMSGKRSTSFRVRAVSDKAVSSYSNYVTPGSAQEDGEVYVTEGNKATGVKEYKVGSVVKENLFEGSDYKSPYKTQLMIESNYDIAMKMTAASKSLNSNSYYRISVWVKTENGAKAGITASNVSKVLSADVEENYIGYMGVDTEGKWTKFYFYIKTGNSSTSLTLELSLGNPYAVKTSKKSEAVTSSVNVYDEKDLSSGTVYFDAVKVEEIKKKVYEEEIEHGEYNEDGSIKLHDFKDEVLKTGQFIENNKYAIRNLVYTVDSFDSFTENTTNEGTDGYNLGHTPGAYTWGKSSDATGTTEKTRMYGVYNYENDSIEKLESLYTITDEDNEVEEPNAFKDFMPDGFDIREFLAIDGYNSLVMSNKSVFGQHYTTSDSYTINASSYYRLRFKAKTLIRRAVTKDDVTTYEKDGVNAEFRFMQTGSDTKYESILINSEGRTDDIYEAVEYTYYIYNPSSSASTIKWAFYLGDNVDEENVSTAKQFIIGMMVIDSVSLEEILPAAYEEAKTSTNYDNLSDDDKLKSAARFFSYDEDKKNDNDNNGDNNGDDDNGDGNKTSIWDRGDAWLLISSIVIAVVIIIVVVVVVIRRWKKKHPKEVVGENKAQPTKDLPPVVTSSQEKEDVNDDEEYSDAKPVYNQRVLPKKDKKKKKK